MTPLFVFVGLFTWKGLFIFIGAAVVIYLALRNFIFLDFFNDLFQEIEKRKKEKAQSKWKALLKKDISYFFPDEDPLFGNHHYNNYTESQVKDLVQKSKGILDMLRVSNLNFPYYEASWENEKQEMEKRFDTFLNNILEMGALNRNAKDILNIKKELRPNMRKITFSQIKELMFKRLEARIDYILKDHLVGLKNDNGKGKKEDWKMFFDLSNKLCRVDDPILVEIASEINKLP